MSASTMEALEDNVDHVEQALSDEDELPDLHISDKIDCDVDPDYVPDSVRRPGASFHKECPCSFHTDAPKRCGRCLHRSIGVFDIAGLQSWKTYMRRVTYVTFSSQHYHRNQS